RARTSYAGTGESGATAPSTREVARVRPTTCRLPSAASRVTLYSTSPPPVAAQVTVIDGSSALRAARTSVGAGTASGLSFGGTVGDAVRGCGTAESGPPACRGPRRSGAAGSEAGARLVVASGVAGLGAARSGSGSGRVGGSGRRGRGVGRGCTAARS